MVEALRSQKKPTSEFRQGLTAKENNHRLALLSISDHHYRYFIMVRHFSEQPEVPSTLNVFSHDIDAPGPRETLLRQLPRTSSAIPITALQPAGYHWRIAYNANGEICDAWRQLNVLTTHTREQFMELARGIENAEIWSANALTRLAESSFRTKAIPRLTVAHQRLRHAYNLTQHLLFEGDMSDPAITNHRVAVPWEDFERFAGNDLPVTYL